MMSESEKKRAALAAFKTVASVNRGAIHPASALRDLGPRVRFQERKLQRIRDEQTAALVAGRQAGLSWADLAELSGVSRQAVQQRVTAVLSSAG